MARKPEPNETWLIMYDPDRGFDDETYPYPPGSEQEILNDHEEGTTFAVVKIERVVEIKVDRFFDDVEPSKKGKK